MTLSKKCKYCGIEFTTTYSDKIYCSPICRDRAKSKFKRQRNKKLYAKHKIACAICGYNKSKIALDFHHLDPNGKEERISILIGKHSVAHIEEEINKCIVLCANCHRELHAGLIKL